MKLKHSNDSMELLLDAMCNVFGAVLLTAILIGGAETVKSIANPAGMVDKKLYLQAQKELQLLESRQKMADLEKTMLQALPAPPAAPPDNTEQQLLQHYRQKAAQLNALAQKIESLKQALAQDKALLEFARLPENPAPENSSANELTLSGSRRTAGLQPWRLLITPQGIHVIGSNPMIRRGSTRNSAVTIKHFEADKNDFYRITANSAQAIKAEDFKLDLPREKQDSRHPGYFAELLVHPQASAQAAWIIKNLRHNNIPYHWRFVSHNGALLRTASKGSKYEVSR